MKIQRTILLIFIAMIVSSCNTYQVDIEGNADIVTGAEKVALLNVYIDPPFRATFPLIDASIYNSSFSDIFGHVSVLHKNYADTMYAHIAHKVEEYSKKKVLYGDELWSKLSEENLERFKLRSVLARVDDEDFPKAVTPQNSVNVFTFINESSTREFFTIEAVDFDNPEAHVVKKKMATLCKLLEVDCIFIASVSVPTVRIGMFGGSGDRRMFADIMYYDAKGDNVCHGIVKSRAYTGDPESLKNYEAVLKTYFGYMDVFLRYLYLGEDPATNLGKK